MATADLEKNVSIAEKALEKNPHVDVSAILSMEHEKDERSFLKEYVFSVIFAPLGIYYAIKLFANDDKKQALICLILTIIMSIIYILIGNALLAGFQVPTSQSIIGY